MDGRKDIKDIEHIENIKDIKDSASGDGGGKVPNAGYDTCKMKGEEEKGR
jgi:hypothetical protein